MTEPLTVAAPLATHHTAVDTPAASELSTFTSAESIAAELADLRDRLAAAQAELSDTRDELEAARTLRGIRENEFTDFKDRVARVAMRYAREHNWCSVVTEALSDLDLQPPDVAVSGTFTVTYRFSGRILPSDEHRLSREWIRQSLDIDTDSGPSLDSDWSDVQIDVERVDIDDYAVDEED